MLDNLKKYQIILASNSPRRKELMSGLGVDYVVRTLPDVNESYPDTLAGAEIPEFIAREKADAYRAMMKSGELLVTADTIVWLDGQVLGSREDRIHASLLYRAHHPPYIIFHRQTIRIYHGTHDNHVSLRQSPYTNPSLPSLQTGPAVRYDENVISNHLAMLVDSPALQEIYKLMSKSIHEHHQL